MTDEAEVLPERIAAIDLGSNSFHMVVADIVKRDPRIVDRVREQVQLASGLDQDGFLTEEACDRAFRCLERFGQTLEDPERLAVRAVGTNTLRTARNAHEFLIQAEAALGHPIEIVSGQEEARLIYLGGALARQNGGGNRLVVDIGGGSTECILGRHFEAQEAHSLCMGCVVYSKRFFGNGKLTKKAFDRARLAARLELQTVERRFRELGWKNVVGASGTIRAAASVIREAEWGDAGITPNGLKALEKKILSAETLNNLSLPGLKSERAPVFPGGVAILMALFESLGIKRMNVSSGALREGVIYDLLGRIHHEDVRERTIRRFETRYHVDLAQADRVEKTALDCLEQVAKDWSLDDADAAIYLGWAVRLHEVGLSVSYRHHHRHAAYIVTHADMPGFSRDDQLILAVLLAAHRRKIEIADLSAAPERWQLRVPRLVAILRLAVLMNRARSDLDELRFWLRASKNQLTLEFDRAWLDEHPLTRMDLDREVSMLQSMKIKLSVVEVD